MNEPNKTDEDVFHSPGIVESYLAAIIQSSYDAIISKGLDGVITSWNNAAEKIFGYTAAEAVGKHISLIIPKERLDEETQIISQLKAGKSINHFETVRVAKDGRLIDLSITVSPIRDMAGFIIGASKVARDITEKKQFERALKKANEDLEIHVAERTRELREQEKALSESRAFLRAVIDTVADPIFVKDSNHRWIEGNTAFWALLGPEESVRGKTDYDLFPKEQADAFWEDDNRIFETGESHDAEGKLRGLDGNDIQIRTRKMPFTMASGEKALVGIIRDITQQRQFEEELRQHRVKLQELVHVQTQDLSEAKERAEEANKAKGEFIANMSHEIRTPMNAVVGIASILEDGKIEPLKQKELLKTLTLSAHQLMELINDLLDAAKIQDSSFTLESVPFDLKKVVAEAVSINKVEAQNKKITLDYDYKCRISTMFMGDPVRLRQVIMNLVGNALKFTSQGGVHIDIDCAPSHLDGVLDVRIDVVDTGIGIAPDVVDTIFDRFKQANQSISETYGGTGLGLSISRQLAEMMGGNISVRSELGKGSCFTVALPMKIAGEASAVAEKFSEMKKLIPSETAKPCILLVEDYEPNVLVTSMLLESFGYRCAVAYNGNEALARLEQGGMDLVLMDVQMPTMDGFTATRLWREREAVRHHKRIPIIGMTAHALQGDRERCEVSGMDEYISKPFDAAELQSKVATLLAK